MKKTIEEIKRDILLFPIYEGRYNPFYLDELDENLGYDPGIGCGDYCDDSLYILDGDGDIVGITLNTAEENIGSNMYFENPGDIEIMKSYYLSSYDSLLWRNERVNYFNCFEQLECPEKHTEKVIKESLEQALTIWNEILPIGVWYVINEHCKKLAEKWYNVLCGFNRVVEKKEFIIIPDTNELVEKYYPGRKL